MKKLLFLLALTAAGCASGGEVKKNACGGTEALEHAPGEECGLCGAYACDGPDAITCEGADANACGGCATLALAPGADCGLCGTVACQGADHAACEDPGANACGGCAALAGQPGTECGDCGLYQCAGTDAVECAHPNFNGCGGCEPLEHEPGALCGCSGDGQWECQSQNAVACSDTTSNACGGCNALTGDPGDACGVCGQLACDGPETLSCADPGHNDCGSCAVLLHTPGDACACGEGLWACAGADAVACELTTLDGRTNARDLGNYQDTQDQIFTTYNSLFPGEDTEDWFRAYCTDEFMAYVDFRGWLQSPPGHDYDLCMYYLAHTGEGEVDCVTGTPDTFEGLPGCCSRNAGTVDEAIEFEPNALGSTDEDGTIYYRVIYVSGPGTCTTFRLQFAF
jgi:hypothetical protein